MANRHTIILMQTSQSRASRTFMDYDSISQAMDENTLSACGKCFQACLTYGVELPPRYFSAYMDTKPIILYCGICGLYERKLKELNPALRNITYDIGDLYNFIDGLADMSALVYDHSMRAYLPYDRQWIKQRTFQHLKKLAH